MEKTITPNKWFSAFLGFFIPPLAFVYLAKFKLAVCYFALAISFGIFDYLLAKKVGVSGLGLLLAIICCIHAFKTAKLVHFSGGRKWYNHWWGSLSIPAAFVFVVLSIRSFLYEPFHIPSQSMVPTLNVGDHVLVSKWGYGLYGTFGITVYKKDAPPQKTPKRGELFVLYPPYESRVFIERVIGLPNDHIEFSDKQLRVNGTAVQTTQNDAEIYTEFLDGNTYLVQYINESNPYRRFSMTVPDNTYFVMGDNRDNSLDSRAWWFVPAENIVGKVVLIW